MSEERRRRNVKRRKKGQVLGEGYEAMQWLIAFLIIRLFLPVHAAWADDANVLPQGVFRLGAEARFSLPITKRFTPGGGTEDLAADFNRDLNSTVFRSLRL